MVGNRSPPCFHPVQNYERGQGAAHSEDLLLTITQMGKGDVSPFNMYKEFALLLASTLVCSYHLLAKLRSNSMVGMGLSLNGSNVY